MREFLITTYPRVWVTQQMEFNSRLLKLNDDADIVEELKGLNFLEISGKPGILIEKILGESGKVRDNRLNSYKNDLFSPLL